MLRQARSCLQNRLQQQGSFRSLSTESGAAKAPAFDICWQSTRVHASGAGVRVCMSVHTISYGMFADLQGLHEPHVLQLTTAYDQADTRWFKALAQYSAAASRAIAARVATPNREVWEQAT